MNANTILRRVWKAISAPWKMLFAKLFPEKYAQLIGVHMHGGVRIYGSSYFCFGTEPWMITLGSNVHITSNVRFITHDGATLIFRKIKPDLEITKPIHVGNDVYFGVNSMILPGVSIGNQCVIAAGAIVAHDVPNNSVVAGVPARVIETADAYFKKAVKNSLHLGHLAGKAKDAALRQYYGKTKER